MAFPILWAAIKASNPKLRDRRRSEISRRPLSPDQNHGFGVSHHSFSRYDVGGKELYEMPAEGQAPQSPDLAYGSWVSWTKSELFSKQIRLTTNLRASSAPGACPAPSLLWCGGRGSKNQKFSLPFFFSSAGGVEGTDKKWKGNFWFCVAASGYEMS